jgi:DNA polymerase-3 subunit delta'
MKGLSAIVGQPRAIEVLRAALAAHKIHHAYLFEGPDGVGKATAARSLAMALNCEAPDGGDDGGGCGRCASCGKILSGHHPDLVSFDMTGKGLTERVRDLLPQLAFRPHEGRARVVVVDPADELAQGTAQAANALLKTLEEPPAGTHFVLVTAQPRKLPVTVLSRCQRVRFLPLAAAEIARWLVEVRGAEPSLAQAAARRAHGSLGRALVELEAGDEQRANDERLAALFDAAGARDPRRVFEVAGELGGDREAAIALLTAAWRTLHAGLLEGEGVAAGRLDDEERAQAARLLGARPVSGLLAGLAATQEALEALEGNVAPALTLEHLMLGLGRDAPARPGSRS